MKEINIGGIYIAPIAGDLLIACLLYVVIGHYLRGAAMERRIWHPQLFRLCIFIIILSVLTLL